MRILKCENNKIQQSKIIESAYNTVISLTALSNILKKKKKILYSTML